MFVNVIMGIFDFSIRTGDISSKNRYRNTPFQMPYKMRVTQ
jgi:hypothetical protein